MIVKVVKIEDTKLHFDNGVMLYAKHYQDCSESHDLSMTDLTLFDFEGLEFDLTSDTFFKRIEGYGIELMPVTGYSVRIPGYGYNNGHYSDDLTMVISNCADFKKEYDITECQVAIRTA